MEQVPAVVMNDVPVEEQSPSMDVTSANSDAPKSEDTADSNRPDSGPYCCQDCGEDFGEEAAYLDHRHQNPNGKCTMYLGPMDDSDMPDEDEESSTSCQLCTLSFTDMSLFRAHMESHRIQSSDTQPIPGPPKQNLFECTECGKKYSILGHFLNHERTHIQASKSLLNDLEHLKKKSFQCETCGRNYSRASALDAHRRYHEEKLIKSRKTDTNAAKLLKKQTSATSEKLFKCFCGKPFSGLKHLKTHQRFSQNIDCFPKERTEKMRKNVYYCRECKKSFNGLIGWFNHEKWHENHSKDSPNRFPCETCGKVFMTETFYNRHQRMAHGGETPVKSFLHQVDQVQKKAIECTICGLKFSRLSALHSHQLQHVPAFVETDKLVQAYSPPLPQQETLEGELKVTQQLTQNAEDHPDVDEPEEDVMETYEPGDLNVMVISASESEDEPEQDLNPNLDSGSDQEGQDNVSVSNLVSKPELDLKIVQVDLDPAKEQCPPTTAPAEANQCREPFACPACYRCFASEPSLRVHISWHYIRKKRHWTKGQSVEVYTRDNEVLTFAAGHTPDYENETNQESNRADVFEQKIVTCYMCGTDLSHLSDQRGPKTLCRDCERFGLFNRMSNHATPSKESGATKAYNPKKTLLGPKIYHCEQCGKGFWSLGAYSHHKQNPSQCDDVRLRTGATQLLHSGRSRSSMKVACPVCGRKFRHKGLMTLHMRTHENGNHKCEFCERSFRLFSSLLRHQVVHNELLPPPSKSFQHQVEQLQKNTYSCPACGKLFSRAKALQFHMRYHENESERSPSPPRPYARQEDFRCAVCLEHFANRASLRAHRKLCVKKESHGMERKTENENIKSVKLPDVNSKGSASPRDFKKEMEEAPMENKNDLKYKCNKCQRSFSIVGALNLHKRVHAKGNKKRAKGTLSSETGEEALRKGYPFPCSECGKRFLSNSALGSHKRWHTNNNLCALRDPIPDGCLSSPPPQPNSDTLDSCTGTPLTCAQSFSVPEHANTLEAEEGDSSLTATNGVTDVESESSSTTPVAKNYQCSFCSDSFSKARGLRAHSWQAHSERREDKAKSVSDAQFTNCEIKSENVSTEISPFDTSVPNLECDLPDPKLYSRSKMAIQAPELSGKVSPLLSRLSEPIVKCLFKCGKCGKAFQTEGQLESHKSKAKSRPFACALCCHGFLTDSQLQQHLAWHDQVRFRLPDEVRLRLSAALNTVRPTGTYFPPLASKKQESKKDVLSSSVAALDDSRAFSKRQQAAAGDCQWQSDGLAAVLSGDTDVLTCLECGATFSRETDLRWHYTKHAQGMY
ncbi:zinc finger protein 208 [Syngnathus typhle]|uniref:zinc finger protein 208 n=1 Tax=Syngnathus typhle TaxID=161592 RepID=UPI002A69F179|nr:zinc finger protein 208 [Syngnathus typhle]